MSAEAPGDDGFLADLARIGRVHLFSGAEAPALRPGVSAVSSLEWDPVGVLRPSACEQSERFDSTVKTAPGGWLAGNVASGNCLASPDGCNPLLRTHAPGGAHAAGLRSCRADVMPPDAAPLSFRGSCNPLAKARGFMTHSGWACSGLNPGCLRI